MSIVLYLHILAATAWIGGAVMLFGLGIFIKDKNAIKLVYGYIGKFYGFFEIFWLSVLITTGIILMFEYGLFGVLFEETELSTLLITKLLFVSTLIVASIIHTLIALKTLHQEKTFVQTILSRSASMLIFLLNLFILWYAIGIRNLL